MSDGLPWAKEWHNKTIADLEPHRLDLVSYGIVYQCRLMAARQRDVVNGSCTGRVRLGSKFLKRPGLTSYFVKRHGRDVLHEAAELDLTMQIKASVKALFDAGALALDDENYVVVPMFARDQNPNKAAAKKREQRADAGRADVEHIEGESPAADTEQDAGYVGAHGAEVGLRVLEGGAGDRISVSGVKSTDRHGDNGGTSLGQVRDTLKREENTDIKNYNSPNTEPYPGRGDDTGLDGLGCAGASPPSVPPTSVAASPSAGYGSERGEKIRGDQRRKDQNKYTVSGSASPSGVGGTEGGELQKHDIWSLDPVVATSILTGENGQRSQNTSRLHVRELGPDVYRACLEELWDAFNTPGAKRPKNAGAFLNGIVSRYKRERKIG